MENTRVHCEKCGYTRLYDKEFFDKEDMELDLKQREWVKLGNKYRCKGCSRELARAS